MNTWESWRPAPETYLCLHDLLKLELMYTTPIGWGSVSVRIQLHSLVVRQHPVHAGYLRQHGKWMTHGLEFNLYWGPVANQKLLLKGEEMSVIMTAFFQDTEAPHSHLPINAY